MRDNVRAGMTANSRDILDPVFLLELDAHVVRQLARHLGGVHAAHVALEPLPLGDPRLAGVGQGDDALEDLRRAVLDLVGRVAQVQKVLTVGTTVVAEVLVLRVVSSVNSWRGRGGPPGEGGLRG